MAVTLRQLLEKKARIVAEMRAMVDGDDAMTPEQQAAFDKLKAAITELEAAIANRASVEDMERRMASPAHNVSDRPFESMSRDFSIVRAIAHAAGMRVDAGREIEVSAELARRSDRPFNGVAVPMLALSRPIERRVLTTALPAGDPGGSLIGTYLDPTQFIDLLRAQLRIRKLGARVVGDLVSHIDIPRMNYSAVGKSGYLGTNGGWVAENTPLPFSDPGCDRISLRPKSAGCITEISRNVLMQSTPDVEMLVREDLALGLARVLDAAAISGTGTQNDPVGILNMTGGTAPYQVGSVAIGTNGGAITWAKILQMIEIVELANAPDGDRAFLSTPRVKAQNMQTPKVSGVAGIGMIQDSPDELAGYPFAQTTLMPDYLTKGTGTALSAMIFGAWSDLLIGTWSALDILVNPYESVAYSKGNVQVRAMMTVDIQARHPQSFCVCSDIAAP